MERTFEFTHVARNVIPPRCRKPRDIGGLKGMARVTIPEISAAEFPVAIETVASYDWQRATVYYWWDNRLWMAYEPNVSRWSGTPEEARAYFGQYASPFNGWYGWYTLTEQIERVRAWARQFVIVDGLLYQESGEPRYEVCTFGLGHNHGSTAVMVQVSYNSNVPASRYFRADQLEEALASATWLAAKRGDTNNIPMVAHETLRVLIPDAIRCQPAQEHGDGDPFINSLNAISEGADSAFEAELGAMVLLMKELR